MLTRTILANLANIVQEVKRRCRLVDLPNKTAEFDGRLTVRNLLSEDRSATVGGDRSSSRSFALAIAAVGLFGVLSYTVAQRSREIGVRTALGARTADILGLVLRSGMAITVAGLAVGLAAAALLVKSLSMILYGVRPLDPATFTIVPLVLALAAAVACIAPARRAASIDPIRAMRPE
jgi:hypothetical protein